MTTPHAPTSAAELRAQVLHEMQLHGLQCDLNHIDVSNVGAFTGVFKGLGFNGDISKWDMRNAYNTSDMFEKSAFNGDISNWDMSNVFATNHMFYEADFNGDISRWNVARIMDCRYMFAHSKFNGDISQWDMREPLARGLCSHLFVRNTAFSGDLSQWRIVDPSRFENVFSADFQGVLPRPALLTNPYAQYDRMFEKEHALDGYLATRPFNHVHADVLCASAIRPNWFARDDYEWFQEVHGMGTSIGLGHEELGHHVLQQYRLRHGLLPASTNDTIELPQLDN